MKTQSSADPYLHRFTIWMVNVLHHKKLMCLPGPFTLDCGLLQENIGIRYIK